MRLLTAFTAAAATLGLAACYQVQTEGALIRQFSLPTFAEFVQDPHVSNVVVGTVEASRTTVSQPGSAVETILTITVESSRESSATTVTAREYGGIVNVEQVRGDFESKLGRKLTKKELAEKVDYQWGGVSHAQIGDHVLLAVSEDTSGAADYTTLTRLASTASATSGADSASFDWTGEPPNPAWDTAVTPADLY